VPKPAQAYEPELQGAALVRHLGELKRLGVVLRRRGVFQVGQKHDARESDRLRPALAARRSSSARSVGVT